MRYAVFAGGCFWCIAPVFDTLPGVSGVTCGYSGGSEERPAYAQVKRQETGHRECIRVEYDPAAVSYGRLLEVFLAHVDPFDGEGQFIDRGRSYTLAVYCDGPEQQAQAEQAIARLQERSGRQVRVTVEPLGVFWTAEEEHQGWYLKHPEEFAREMAESGRTLREEGRADV